jgi:histone H3/H4
MLLKQSAIRAIVKAHGMRLDSGLLDALDAKVKEVLDVAVERARDANRQTVRKADL